MTIKRIKKVKIVKGKTKKVIIKRKIVIKKKVVKPLKPDTDECKECKEPKENKELKELFNNHLLSRASFYRDINPYQQYLDMMDNDGNYNSKLYKKMEELEKGTLTKELIDDIQRNTNGTVEYIMPENDKRCCEERELREDFIAIRCINCGQTFNLEEDLNIYGCIRNPKYKLSTKMSYQPKYRTLQRLHTWSNYDYKENTANANYEDIKTIGKIIKLSNPIIDNACNFYKQIYIDNQISSRNKIKHCLYIYCLFKSANCFNTTFDLLEVLKKNKLSTDNYNKAMLKVEGDDKLFLHKDMKKYISFVIEKYDIEIDVIELIRKYNELYKLLLTINNRVNKNSVLMTTIYLIIKPENQKEFIKEFPITKTTLYKFLKIIKDNKPDNDN